MTQHKDRKTKIRARMAADSISYARAALLVDREAGQAPGVDLQRNRNARLAGSGLGQVGAQDGLQGSLACDLVR